MFSLKLFSILFFNSILGFVFFIYINNYIAKIRPRQIQDVHDFESSRHGGIVFLVLFNSYNIYLNHIDITLLLCSLFICVPAIIEDFKFNLNPILRLLLILIFSFVLIANLDSLPKFEITILENILNNFYFQIIFYTLCLTVIINGQNIIDGTNGLSALTSLSIYFSLFFLANKFNDIYISSLCLFIITIILSFLIFNFPLGKIFLGDSGSYFLGLMSGYMIILFFGKYNELFTWHAVLILFYPSFEVFFSYLRKVIARKSPFYPDSRHLHLKTFHFLNRFFSTKFSNNLVVLFLIPVWLSPSVLLTLFYNDRVMIMISIFICLLIYLIIYFFLPSPKKDT